MKGLNPVNKGLINSNWDKCQIRWANVIRPGIDLVCAFKCIQYDSFYKVFCVLIHYLISLNTFLK